MNNERWPQQLRSPSDIGSGSGEQGDEEKIPYSVARNMRTEPGIIAKVYSAEGWQRTVDEELAKVPKELREALYVGSGKVSGGREVGHLLRLLSRKGVEYDFGVAFLKYSSEIFRDKELRQETNTVLNGELTDTMMWWTYAPYVYQELVKSEVEEQEALKLTLEWAAKSPAGHGRYEPWEAKHQLPGLEVLNKEKIRKYTLSGNSEDITHKFTQQEAKRVVKEVFHIEKKKK